jgi:carbon storage regulator CsrA
MLILSRRLGEEILIGQNVRLVVHRIVGKRVSLGIVAPRDMHVVRGELRSKDARSRAPTNDRSPSPAV